MVVLDPENNSKEFDKILKNQQGKNIYFYFFWQDEILNFCHQLKGTFIDSKNIFLWHESQD